ncbi:MAG: hypothetical protein J7L82_05505 [Staphylothermus sp.]|nr:hypothetical protein [Staphylothermus sp.]
MFVQIVKKRFGYKINNEICVFKLLMNGVFLKILRDINREKYMKWDWFNKPFSLKNCVFISDDGYKFMSYSKEIFRVLKGDKTELLNEIKELISTIAPKCTCWI